MSEIKKHEEKCSSCSERQACVPFFLHENAMMHKDMDNERMSNVVKEVSKISKGQKTANIIQSIIILLVVFCMAMFYTHRTQMFNDTITQLNHTIVELMEGKTPFQEVTNAKDNSAP